MPLLVFKNRSVHETPWMVVGLVAFLGLILLDRGRTFNYAGQPAFWDAHVYARAVRAFRLGSNPYVCDSSLVFVYPPIVLYVARALSYVFHGNLAWISYLTLNLCSLVTIPVVIARCYIRSQWFNAGCALLVATFHPFFTSAFSFFAGNISNLLYAFVLLAGVSGLRKNRWLGFYITLAVAATVKVGMLSFLLLPLLLGEQQLDASALTGVAVLAVYAVQRVVIPGPYQAYLAAARYQVLVRRDLGFGVCSTLFRLLRRVVHTSNPMMLLVHTVSFGTLVLAMFWVRRRGIPTTLQNQWVSLVLLLAVLCNPRMLAYDIDLVVVLTAFLIVEAFTTYRALRGSSSWLAGLVLVSILAVHRNPLESYCLLAVMCFPIASYLWLRPSRTIGKSVSPAAIAT